MSLSRIGLSATYGTRSRDGKGEEATGSLRSRTAPVVASFAYLGSTKLTAMLTYLRYALATFCFAASVGCLTLWGWNLARSETLDMAHLSVASTTFNVEACFGIAAVWSDTAKPNDHFWRAGSHRLGDITEFAGIMRQQGLFGTIGPAIYFPLWYPALIFALAPVAALRLGRRFTLRSAIIATTVVAVLLAMAVIL